MIWIASIIFFEEKPDPGIAVRPQSAFHGQVVVQVEVQVDFAVAICGHSYICVDIFRDIGPNTGLRCTFGIGADIQIVDPEILAEFWQVGEVVVCSRTEEYELQQLPLRLNGAIILRPLTEAKIKAFVYRTEGEMLWESLVGRIH